MFLCFIYKDVFRLKLLFSKNKGWYVSTWKYGRLGEKKMTHHPQISTCMKCQSMARDAKRIMSTLKGI